MPRSEVFMLNREDPRSAIPQLEKMIEALREEIEALKQRVKELEDA